MQDGFVYHTQEAPHPSEQEGWGQRVSYRLPWVEPLDFARGFAKHHDAAQHDWVLLYSGQTRPGAGARSLMAWDPCEHVIASDFFTLAEKLSTDQACFSNAWFGYLGYGLKHSLERLPHDTPGAFTMADLWMSRFRTVLVFDHDQRELNCYADMASPVPNMYAELAEPVQAILLGLTSNLTREGYLAAVRDTIAEIERGAFYQANITRKFVGKLAEPVPPFAVFDALCAASPAPYSAFMKRGEHYILSSSPECFLSIQPSGRVVTRPIKGTVRRVADAESDQAIAEALHGSAKNRAENLMIVDLMRNDLAKSCTPGSVVVEKLFDIESYSTLHHMVSTVSGQLREDMTPISLVAGCFPPGSMTGAPKHQAMTWCTAQERLARGVYSGALGWFGGDGSAELSVVIRTLLLHEDGFEFQVGGGIVADSDPEQEWRETLTKAQAIARALGIDMAKLEAL